MHRLMIDFPDDEALAQFVLEARANGVLPDDVGVFKCESLDFNARSGGVGRAHTYLLRTPAAAEQEGRERLTIQRTEEI